MANRKSLIDADGEVRNLTGADIAKFRPAADVLPPVLAKKLGVRGRQKAATKERISIRLSQDVVERFRATGQGWQSRIDFALKDWLKTRPFV